MCLCVIGSGLFWGGGIKCMFSVQLRSKLNKKNFQIFVPSSAQAGKPIPNWGWYSLIIMPNFAPFLPKIAPFFCSKLHLFLSLSSHFSLAKRTASQHASRPADLDTQTCLWRSHHDLKIARISVMHDIERNNGLIGNPFFNFSSWNIIWKIGVHFEFFLSNFFPQFFFWFRWNQMCYRDGRPLILKLIPNKGKWY